MKSDQMPSVRVVLKKLAEWGFEGCDSVCARLYRQQLGCCRHERAREAIVQVGNAVKEIKRRR